MTASPRRHAQVAFGVLGAALALSACSSGSSTSTSSPAPPQSGGAGSLPPPTGAKQLDSQDDSGVQYTRYSISGTSPQQVVTDYEASAKSAGYTVTNSGSGGGGWGGYGGASAGMTASMSGSYLDVQAGGSSSGPTYFEVCMGANESAVDQCNQNSNKAADSQSNGS